MERFDDYWGEPAPFETLTFQYVEEVASRVTGLVNGEFDLVTNIPPDQESAMQADRHQNDGGHLAHVPRLDHRPEQPADRQP